MPCISYAWHVSQSIMQYRDKKGIQMKKVKAIAATCASAMVLGMFSTQATAAADVAADKKFVSAKNTHFMRQGQTYYIVGANFWYGAYLGKPDAATERARLHKELDNLKAMGVNNLRVLAVSEKTEMTSAVKPATTQAPGQYDENLLLGLDYLLAEIAKRDMTVVLYLNNFWQWSGGMTQYMNWFEGSKALDPNVTGDYEDFMFQTARFYQNKDAQKEYQNTIKKIVTRVNTITGQAYSNDASILSWQLANEPRPGNSKATAQEKTIYTAWVNDTAKYIHGLDKNHMVSSGSEGLMGSANDQQLYLDAHKSPYIDYMTYHLWPKNWSWFDSKKPVETWDGAMVKCKDYLNSHIDFAKKLHKPIVLEEFGMDRDGATFDVKATTHVRDRFYTEVFSLLYRRAKAGDAIAGFNFWAWNGSGRAGHADYWWKTGDDFLGDPPQEEQGLYGVFDSDVTTILLIKETAGKMHALQK